MNTRMESISAFMAATSPEYRNAWVGLKVAHTNDAGKRVKGTITGWGRGLPVATLTDGTSVRLKAVVEIVP